jgi:citrate lyase subunit beta/citryl-CoA lyase
MKEDLPVWRSLMYVPVNVEKYVEKAHTRGADCLQLDLEDSVPAAEKAAARKLVAAAAKRVRRGGGDVVVRINSPRELAEPDLEFSIGEDVDGIAVTKAQSAEHIRRIDEFISKLETKRGMRVGHTRLIAMVETPGAFFQMPAIAQASPRLAAMNIGGEDFALETGMEPTEETLLMPKQHMVRRSRQFGFMGAGCIHPGQVPIVNREYSPSADEVTYARRIVEENARHEAAGRASWSLDGKMIDVPVVVRAQRLLARHAAIQAREAKKSV